MENAQKLSLADSVQGAGVVWFGYFIFALASASIANGIFGVPLHQIVDVDFSVVLFFVALSYAGIFILLFFNIMARSLTGIIACLFLVVLYAGTSLAGAAAYLLYAWFDGVHLAGSSFVYDGYAHIVSFLSKAIGVGVVTGVAVGKTVNWWGTMEGIATVGSCFTILSSAVARFFNPPAREQEAHA